MIAFAPAVAFALLWALLRARPGMRSQVLRAIGVAIAVVVVPALLYVLLSATVWDRPVWGAAAGSALPGADPVAPPAGSLREQISYTWGLFAPGLGLFAHLHPTPNPLYDVWFSGFVGRFGWLDYGFPAWLYDLAELVVGLVVVLAVAALVRARDALRGRLAEIVTYLLAMIGLAGLIGAAGYRYWLDTDGQRFEQARYLLPLLPLYGALVALAVRGAGRRAAPVVAAVAVVLMIGWSAYAQIITVIRYYG